MMRYLLHIAFLFVFCLALNGQIMPAISLFSDMPIQYNPASTGSKDALAVGIKFRKHWTGIEGAPSTQVFSAHAPLRNPRVAMGLLLENENIGATNYTGIFLNYSYKIPVLTGKLSFGIKGGITAGSQSSILLRDGIDRAFNENNNQFIVPNFGFGTYYYEKSYWAGFSIPRFFGFESKESGQYQMVHDVSRYEYFITGGGIVNIKSDITVEPSALIVLSSVLKPEFTINCIGAYRETFRGGVGFRSSDAIIIHLGYNMNRQLTLIYSYDINIGKMSTYTSGSHEVNMQYKFGYTVNTSSPRHF